MAGFTFEVWAALLAIGAVAVLAFLYTLAAAIRNEVAAHDLKVKVARLRIDYYRRIQADGGAALSGGVIEVGPVDHDVDSRMAA